MPNCDYVLMATLERLVYGWVWVRTRRMTASAVAHMLVNFVRGIVFH